MEERRKLHSLCCECRFADRESSGLPIGCLIECPSISKEGACSDYSFWWTRPPVRERHWLRYILIVLGVILLGIPLLIKGIVSFLSWIAPKINKDNLGLYLPGYRRR